MLVAEQDARPAGYIVCHLQDDGSGRIGLMGTEGGARSPGLGTRLLHRALSWFHEREVRDVTVATQGSNVAAQRLFQKCGFLTTRMQLWYHLWPAFDARENG